MADTAFGIIGTVSLAIQLGQMLDKLRRDFVDIPEDLKLFSSEISHHRANLISAQAVLQPNSAAGIDIGSTTSSAASANDWIQPCHDELARVVDELSMPKKSLRRRWDRIKKALRADSLRASMERLHRYCDQVNQQVDVQTLGVVRQIHAQLQDDKSKQRQRAILDWLSKFPHTRRQQDLQEMWQKGTVDWVFEQDVFMDWCGAGQATSGIPVIWYHGGPGVGKSVMTSRIVHELEEQRPPDVAVLYLYCDYKDRANQNLQSLLSSLTRQASEQAIEMVHGLPAEIEAVYERYSEGTLGCITREDAEKLLISLLGMFRRSFILIDGLDEFVNPGSERGITPNKKPAAILECVYSICGRSRSGELRLLITSRDHMPPLHPDIPAVKVAMTAASSDIRIFVEAYIATKSFYLADEVRARNGLGKEITKKIVDKASGQFLFASLTVQDLGNEDNIRELKEALECLPADHIDRYKEALERINLQQQQKKSRTSSTDTEPLGMRVLALLFHAHRPLTVEEVRHALATREGDITFDRDGLCKPEVITSSGMGLVRINNESQFEFVHSSVMEFLATQELYAERFSRLEEALVRTCMTYMSFRDFIQPFKYSFGAFAFPFLQYAVHNFGEHSSSCLKRNPSLLPGYLQFIRNGIQLGVWQIFAVKVLQRPDPSRIGLWREALSDLHVSIIVGLVEATAYLLDHGADVDEKDSMGETPLHMAARVQNTAAVQLLLSHGADIHQTNYSGENALNIVLYKPFSHVTLTLSKQAITDRIPSLRGGLEGPVNWDMLNAITLMLVILGLRHTSETTIRTKLIADLTTTLVTLIQLLIDAGADLNACGVAITTPLQLAVIYNRGDLVARMLERGANPWVDYELGFTALELAREQRDADESIAQLISDKMDETVRLEDAEPDAEKKRLLPGPYQAQCIVEQTRKDVAARKAHTTDNRIPHDAAVQNSQVSLELCYLEHVKPRNKLARPVKEVTYSMLPMAFSSKFESLLNKILVMMAQSEPTERAAASAPPRTAHDWLWQDIRIPNARMVGHG